MTCETLTALLAVAAVAALFAFAGYVNGEESRRNG